jgi:hypothetical protein
MLTMLCLFMASCGQVIPPNLLVPAVQLPGRVDPIMEPYVNNFLQECSARGLKEICERNFKALQSVEFAPEESFDEPDTLAVCRMFAHEESQKPSWSQILVRRKAFLTSDNTIFNEPLLKATVFHELGHCILGREHQEEENLGIMSERTIAESYYRGSTWEILLGTFFIESFFLLDGVEHGLQQNSVKKSSANTKEEKNPSLLKGETRTKRTSFGFHGSAGFSEGYPKPVTCSGFKKKKSL